MTSNVETPPGERDIDTLDFVHRPDVMCKICNKSIYRIFVEHIEKHIHQKE